MSDQGYIEVYTGAGKGKTTAAIGLAVRAVGAGKRVFFSQFMKSRAYSEQAVLERLSPLLTLEISGKPFFVAHEGMLSERELELWGEDVVVFPEGKPPELYREMMRGALRRAEEAVASAAYDLVVLDELNVVLFFGLVDREAVELLLKRRHPAVEVVFTGRNAPEWLVERADLVTEMAEVKHYYQQGVAARKGIEN